MARIRTVKPELFKHEELFDLEQTTGLPLRVAFIGLFTCCDREGRFKWRPRTLKLDVLPHDNVDFSRVLDALATRDFVRKYVIGTEEFGVIPTFYKHQVINNRESASDIPPPDENSYVSTGSTREPRVDDASPTPLVQDQGEGKGREGNGKGMEEEGKGKENPLVERRGAAPDRDVVAEIFAYWQKTMNSPKAVLDDKRKSLIKAALKNFEPRQICEAILGCSRSAHHMGENDRNTKYNGLGLILRNAEYIEKFMEMASKTTVGEETIEQRNARITAEILGGDDPLDLNVIDMEEAPYED
jgi:hypothetical protein